MQWLFVVTPENWQRCLESRTWGVKDRYKTTMQRMKTGDEILIHLTENKTAGICKVTREYFEDNSKIWPDGEIYRHRIGIEPLKIPPNPIGGKLSYDKNLRTEHGSPRGYFGNAIREIPDHEFSIFESDIDKSVNEQYIKNRLQVNSEKIGSETGNNTYTKDLFTPLICRNICERYTQRK